MFEGLQSTSMEFLVAVDGSEQGARALRYACEMARAAGADVVVAHAVDPEVYQTEGVDEADREGALVVEGPDEAETRGQEVLDEALEHAHEAGFDPETELLHGDPATVVAEYARERDVTGVYVGHRGLSAEREAMMGSVAKRLVELSAVPVTVVS
jgi:nucleotide-binding universal stress UspA family protein